MNRTPPAPSCASSTGRIGVKEWADESANCVTGCSHNCRYCYAAWDACKHWKRIKPADWEHPRVRENDVRRRRPKIGTMMFPSTHDITPELLNPCLQVLGNLLTAGNDVLLVSKPHLECIRAICVKFAAQRDHILFRFTITADDPDLLAYWEPGAPTFDERLACLKLAKGHGFQTSVSTEPMLDIAHAPRLVRRLLPHITETIWLGKMNNINSRVDAVTDEDRRQVNAIKASQTDEAVWALYHKMKDIPQVEWKDSIKKVVGIPILKAPSASAPPPATPSPDGSVTEFPNPVTVTAAASDPPLPGAEFPNPVTVAAATPDEPQVVEVLAALGHPKRLRIVMELARAGGAMGFTELRTALGLRAVTLSQQFDVLENAEVARRVREGRMVTCHLDQQLLRDIGTHLVEAASRVQPRKPNGRVLPPDP